MIYTGIGSRKTPVAILAVIEAVAFRLGQLGWTLRSGRAPGADLAFEHGALRAACAARPGPRPELYLPWRGFNGAANVGGGLLAPEAWAYDVAARHHPTWQRCTRGAHALHARNVHQICGKGPEPIFPAFVLCWTPGGAGGGGTGQALRVVRALAPAVPIFDLGIKPEWTVDDVLALLAVHRLAPPPESAYAEHPRRGTLMPLFVRHVRGNVKAAIDVDLGAKTLILGPNASLKTAIVNAVELALGGFASDVAGRAIVRDPGLLGALAPGDCDITVAATLSDGEVRTCVMERGKGKKGYGKPKLSHPAALGTFPLLIVREALAGSADTTAAWLVRNVGGAITEADVRERCADRADLVPVPFSVQGLLDKADARKKAATLAAQEADTLEAYAIEAEAAIGSVPLSGEIEAWKAEEAQLQRAIEQALTAERWAEEAASLAQLIEDAKAARDAFRAMPEVSAVTQADLRYYDALELIARRAAQQGWTRCKLCGNDGPTPARLDGVLSGVEALRSKAGHAIKAGQDRQRAEVAFNTKKALAISTAKRHEERGEAPAVTVKVNDARAQQSRLRERISQAAIAKARMSDVAVARGKIAVQREAATTAKADVKRLKELTKDLLKAAIEAFEARVQAFLPPEDKFSVQLTAGDLDVARMGLVDEEAGTLRTALSGAETLRVGLALAAATGGTGDGLRVFVTEDKSLDHTTVRAMMDALATAPGQVLFTSTTIPTGLEIGPDGAVVPETIPAGWTVLLTGEL